MTDLYVYADTDEVEATLLRLQNRLSQNELKAFLVTKALRSLRQRAAARFDTEGDDATGPWQELAYMTGRIRTFQGYQPFHPINVRSGALRRHILTSFKIYSAGADGALLKMPGPGGSALLRSKVEQAQVGGNTRSRRKTGPNRPGPARPVVAMSGVDRQRIGDDLLQFIRSGVMV